MKSMFSCPVCGNNLEIENRTYKCPNRHSFDMAKEGYVNLLISNKSTDFSGDDKVMVQSRTKFLDGGYYSPLRDKMCDILKKLGANRESFLLDTGCGEGYYTSSLCNCVGKSAGVDISKSAVKYAAKRCKNAEFAVASVYHLPVMNSSVDFVINCFSPNAPDEFSRVLKSGGYLLYVVPGPRHLWELKNVLYDTPYENEEKTENYDGFEFNGVERVETEFNMTSCEDIQSLFHMTPYTWNTPKEGAERLKTIDSIHITAQFRIHVYKKT